MSEAVIVIDLATYSTIRRLLDEIEEFKQRWPKDYKDRIGYSSRVEKIMQNLPYAFPKV